MNGINAPQRPDCVLGRQDSNLLMAESKSPDKAKGRKDRNVRVKERPLASAVGVGARHRRIPNEPRRAGNASAQNSAAF